MKLSWTPKTAEGQQPMFTYNRAAAHESEGENSGEKAMHMVYTDYYSYLVGKTCQEVGDN